MRLIIKSRIWYRHRRTRGEKQRSSALRLTRTTPRSPHPSTTAKGHRGEESHGEELARALGHLSIRASTRYTGRGRSSMPHLPDLRSFLSNDGA